MRTFWNIFITLLGIVVVIIGVSVGGGDSSNNDKRPW